MPTSVTDSKFFIAIIAILAVSCTAQTATAQTFTATRLDGDASTPVFDPIISRDTFVNAGSTGEIFAGTTAGNIQDNIDGPSIIRIPDWIPAAERVNANAEYYAYFAHHNGDNIRLAWSDSITGQWNLFNAENSTTTPNSSVGGTVTPGNGVLDLDLGFFPPGSNTQRLSPVSGSQIGVTRHVASPDVLVDHENQQIILGFHAPPAVNPSDQKSFVATSKYGLNFNPAPENGDAADGFVGESGHGIRDVILGESYFRTFEVGEQTFAYANNGNLFQAPTTNAAGEINTLDNAFSEGGIFNPDDNVDRNPLDDYWTEIATDDNPIQEFYRDVLGETATDPRHFAIYTRDHIDPTDTNIYAFYSAKDDTPESILLSVIETNGSTNPADWTVIGEQETILAPELQWEGINNELATSEGGAAVGVRQLRDPFVFEDDKGTADTADDELFLFYTGAGEEAIGVASLTFNATTTPVPEPTSLVMFSTLMILPACRRRRSRRL